MEDPLPKCTCPPTAAVHDDGCPHRLEFMRRVYARLKPPRPNTPETWTSS